MKARAKAKDLLLQLVRSYIDVDCFGLAIISEDAPLSDYFYIADEYDHAEDGFYMYVALHDEESGRAAERLIGQPFDYAFPLHEKNVWIGLIKDED